MATIRMTKELAETLKGLREGYALCKDLHYHVMPFIYNREDFERCISDETAQVLIKNKLVIRRTLTTHLYNWWHSWFSTVWIISDAGKDFKLPPEKYWLEE